jgi:hypothetical protein
LAGRLLWWKQMLRIVVVLPLFACASQPSTPGSPVESRVDTIDLPAFVPDRDIDLLFVVDNSPAIGVYGDRILAHLADLVATIDAYPGGRPNLHIGVTTTDPRDNGALRDGMIVDVGDHDGVRTTNYATTLELALATHVEQVGTIGTPNIQPLLAASLALANPANHDLLRADSYLFVVVIAATDDASPLSVESYANHLKQVVGDPSRVVVAGIYLQPATRLDAFLAQFPDRSTMVSLDAPSYGPALQLIGQLMRTPLSLRCMNRDVDVDPITAGVQLDCAVSAFDETDAEHVIPRCGGASAGWCWQVVEDPNCDVFNQLRFISPHSVDLYEPRVHGECVVAN